MSRTISLQEYKGFFCWESRFLTPPQSSRLSCIVIVQCSQHWPGEYIFTSIIFQNSNIDVCWVWSRLGGQLQRLLYLPLAPLLYCVCVLGSSNMGGDLAWVQVSDLLRHAVPRCHMWKFPRWKTFYTIIINLTPLEVILKLFIAPSQISVQDAYSQDQEVSVCPQRNED